MDAVKAVVIMVLLFIAFCIFAGLFGTRCREGLTGNMKTVQKQVTVGTSNAIKKTVQLPNVVSCSPKPVNSQAANWLDTFSVSIGDGEFTVTRTDDVKTPGAYGYMNCASSCPLSIGPTQKDADGKYTGHGWWGQDLELSCEVKETLCTLPSDFGNGIIGGVKGSDSGWCAEGDTLTASNSCLVACKDGYSPSGAPDDCDGYGAYDCSSSSRYSCSAKGVLTPATLKCTKAPTCTVPSKFPNGVIPLEGNNPCTPGQTLASGLYCNLQCPDSNSDPYFSTCGVVGNVPGTGECKSPVSSIYRCTAGKLEPPTLKCSAPSCKLPSALGTAIVGGDTNPCKAGGDLASGATCSVKCGGGQTSTGGTTTYSCEKGKLTAATLKCGFPDCTLPSSLGTSIVGGDKSPCVPGAKLGAGKTCNVGCAKDHKSTGGTTAYSCKGGKLTAATLKCAEADCTLPRSLGTSIVGGDKSPCVPGGSLAPNKTCNVKCEPKYKPVSGTKEYGCTSGNLVSASLKCEPVTCHVPSTLGIGVTGGGKKPCLTGAAIAADASCGVECKSGYKPGGGTTEYICGETGVMKDATLKCSTITCPLPHDWGLGRAAGGLLPCTPGGELKTGKDCTISCSAGYKAVSGSPQYSCDEKGTLKDATLKCVPNTCSVPRDLGAGVVGAGEHACVQGAQLGANKYCTVGCIPGYDALAGTRDYVCGANGHLTSATLTCRKMKRPSLRPEPPPPPPPPRPVQCTCNVKPCTPGYKAAESQLDTRYVAGMADINVKPFNSIWAFDYHI